MRDAFLTTVLLVVAGVITSCGGGDDDSTLAAADVQEFRSTAERIETEARTYGDGMQQVNDFDACRALAGEHLRQMNALVGTMAAMAPQMDGFMMSRGNPDGADLACTTEALRQEVAHHADVACTFPDVQASRQEAARHAELVERMADHQQAHAAEMLVWMGEMHGRPDMGAIGACTPGGGFQPGGGHRSMPGM